jgi:two-component system response regulator PrrA
VSSTIWTRIDGVQQAPTEPAGRILVVEDDDPVRDAVARGLTLHGFDVADAPDAEAGIDAVARRRPDVLVVDVGLPGMSGIDLCAHLRSADVDIPILILSARDQVGDRVAGLAAGADDYLVKPFDLTELVLRLRSLVRRGQRATTDDDSAIVAGPLWIDASRRHATLAGRRLELSRREFDLLAAFVANPNIVLSRTRLLELVWGYDFEVDTNVVDVFVGYLRRKIEVTGLPRMIHTVRGVGFVLRID